MGKTVVLQEVVVVVEGGLSFPHQEGREQADKDTVEDQDLIAILMVMAVVAAAAPVVQVQIGLIKMVVTEV